MSKPIELHPGEQIIYRTATSLVARSAQYFAGIFLLPLFGLGIMCLVGWGFYHYSDVVITSQRLMLKRTGLFRGGYKSIPLDQIYLSEATTINQGLVGWVGLDLLDGKVVKIGVSRPNVLLARLAEAMDAASSPQ